MRTKLVLSFLALGIFSAAPVSADQISSNLREFLNENSSQDSFHGRNLALGAFNGTIFAQRLSSLDEDFKVAARSELVRFNQNKTSGEESAIATAVKRGNAFGKDGHRDRGKHKPIVVGGGPTSPTVAVPEPSSITLALFGLGALCILLCRRNSQ